MVYPSAYQNLYRQEEPMTLQDLLRGEQNEVADTGDLLAQAADEIDRLEALLAAAPDATRIAELEAALTDIRVRVNEVI